MCSRYLQDESLPTGESDASGTEKAWREEAESRLLRGAADKTAGGYVDQLPDELYLPAGSEA